MRSLYVSLIFIIGCTMGQYREIVPTEQGNYVREYRGASVVTNSPTKVLTSMGGVKTKNIAVEPFKDIKQAATVPRLMAIAGIAALIGAILLIWLGKNWKGGLLLGGLGAGLVASAAMFEIAPWTVFVVPGSLVSGLAYMGFSTAKGQKILRQIISGGNKFIALSSPKISAQFLSAQKEKQDKSTRRVVDAVNGKS